MHNIHEFAWCSNEQKYVFQISLGRPHIVATSDDHNEQARKSEA